MAICQTIGSLMFSQEMSFFSGRPLASTVYFGLCSRYGSTIMVLFTHRQWSEKRTFPPQNRQNNFFLLMWSKSLKTLLGIDWFQKVLNSYHFGEILDLFRGRKFLFLTTVCITNSHYNKSSSMSYQNKARCFWYDTAYSIVLCCLHRL